MVGGINRPKRVIARDDAGGAHPELVKAGHDDLRQDAVMQQLFALVNALLAARPECAARGLAMRTYKAVPFSPAAGLLQWRPGAWVCQAQPLLLPLLLPMLLPMLRSVAHICPPTCMCLCLCLGLGRAVGGLNLRLGHGHGE